MSESAVETNEGFCSTMSRPLDSHALACWAALVRPARRWASGSTTTLGSRSHGCGCRMTTSTDPVVVGLAVWNPNDYDVSTARLEVQLKLDDVDSRALLQGQRHFRPAGRPGGPDPAAHGAGRAPAARAGDGLGHPPLRGGRPGHVLDSVRTAQGALCAPGDLAFGGANEARIATTVAADSLNHRARRGIYAPACRASGRARTRAPSRRASRARSRAKASANDPLQPVEMRDRDGDRPELLLHLPPKDERPLIEEDVAALAVDPGEEHGLDQSLPVVEGGELHRLVLERVHRLGGGEHAGHHHVARRRGGADRCCGRAGSGRAGRRGAAWDGCR